MSFGLAATSWALALLGAGAASGHGDDPVVRQQVEVRVGDAVETWRLEWHAPPREICGPGDRDWWTCPCRGFAFGERGELDLVRLMSDGREERFELTPLFDGETPANDDEGRDAVLQRWPVLDADVAAHDVPRLVQDVHARPSADVMRIADYNRDGWAAEFPLQIETLPCGKRVSVLVGVTPDARFLHLFDTARNPHVPLHLYMEDWERLLGSRGSLKAIWLPCDDHGSDIEIEYEIFIRRGRFEVVGRQYDCDVGGKRGKLIEKDRF